MIQNVIDNRQRQHRWKRINAVVELRGTTIASPIQITLNLQNPNRITMNGWGYRSPTRSHGRYRSQLPDPSGASDPEAFKIVALFMNVATGGKFDTQREGNQLLGLLRLKSFTQHRQFLPIANINVGLYCQQFGMTLQETLTVAGLFARVASANYDSSKPYGLPDRTAYFIRRGYEIGQSGQFGLKPADGTQP
jgi:hypothetical protein